MAETPHRTYDRTWAEIEDMLEQATTKMNDWKSWYDACKDEDDKEGMKEAAPKSQSPAGRGQDTQVDLG